MIIISGKQGEGSGLLTNLAVASILNEKPQTVVLLLDETDEFVHLKNQLDGIKINIGIDCKSIKEQLKDTKKLYIINSNIPIEYCLSEVKEIEKFLIDAGKWVFVIYKTTDIERANLVKNQFEKLN